MADEDPVSSAAAERIMRRTKSMQGVSQDKLPTSLGSAAVEEPTRIRFEMAAIRKLLEKIEAK